MAASSNLPHSVSTPQISKSGVLTLYGFGIRIAVQAGHLQVEYGVGLERRRLRLPRVNHRLKRLVCVGDDGFVSLAALRWLSEVGSSFSLLDRRGKVRVVTGPASPSEARLRRAQALALGNGNAVKIARELISAKLSGQEVLVRDKLKKTRAADSIATLRAGLGDAADLNAIRGIESLAASEYWNAWRDLPILFPRKETNRIPSHWLTFGSRHSPLTGGPRLSVNPANSLLNFTNAVAESECRLAVCACGLDPGLGVLHTDTANRDSLALDLIETIRPAIEAWTLDWLMHEPLRRSDFIEAANGNCRLSSTLCSKLSETAPTWGKLVAPWAEYVAHSLRASHTSRRDAKRGFSTPLTHTNRRKEKSTSPPDLKMPAVGRTCRGCGTPTRIGRNCPKCGREISRDKLIELAKAGRTVALRSEARRKHSKTLRRHHAAKRAWQRAPKTAWPDEGAYLREIQPRLASVTISSISSTLGICESYAADIRAGRYRPHPRHWQVLAALVLRSRPRNKMHERRDGPRISASRKTRRKSKHL
jgi:CRISPR-associated endonuclease Cas1